MSLADASATADSRASCLIRPANRCVTVWRVFTMLQPRIIKQTRIPALATTTANTACTSRPTPAVAKIITAAASGSIIRTFFTEYLSLIQPSGDLLTRLHCCESAGPVDRNHLMHPTLDIFAIRRFYAKLLPPILGQRSFVNETSSGQLTRLQRRNEEDGLDIWVVQLHLHKLIDELRNLHVRDFSSIDQNTIRRMDSIFRKKDARRHHLQGSIRGDFVRVLFHASGPAT